MILIRIRNNECKNIENNERIAIFVRFFYIEQKKRRKKAFVA